MEKHITQNLEAQERSSLAYKPPTLAGLLPLRGPLGGKTPSISSRHNGIDRLQGRKHVEAGFGLVQLLVTASLMGIVGQGMANMMISQYRQQVRAELRADANHGLEIAFLKWERGEAPEAVGGCDFTYVDVDPTVLEISAECTKGVTKTRLTRLFERTTPNL